MTSVLVAAQPRVTPETGLSGQVLAPDGTPVTGGRVTLIGSMNTRIAAEIDRDGRFTIAPDVAGPFYFMITVPGLAPRRFRIAVPGSRTVKLPDIRLSPPTYYRVRLISPAGEPITWALLQKRVVDANGMMIPGADFQVSDRAEADGTVTVGPLPNGIMMSAIDAPPFARMRLPDIPITGQDPVVEGGTIALEAGSRLQVDIVDEHGQAVNGHDVLLEDTHPRSLLAFRPQTTDASGRVTFDRLSQGRYRVWTRTKERCDIQQLWIGRVVAVGSSSLARAHIIIGGTAAFRVVTPNGAMNGARLLAAPDSEGATAPGQLAFVSAPYLRRLPSFERPYPSCGGATNAEGRVTLSPFPPGPADVTVRLLNSTFKRRIIVPDSGFEVEIDIPDGLVSAHVTDQRTNRPVPNATVSWLGHGARVEARTTPNGDALVEGVGTAGGTLSVSAPDFETLEASFTEPPGTVQEISLPPLPSTRLQVRVMRANGEPLPNALVELVTGNPLDVGDFAVTNGTGGVMFADLPRGALRLTVTTEGFSPAKIQVPADNRRDVVVTLTPSEK